MDEIQKELDRVLHDGHDLQAALRLIRDGMDVNRSTSESNWTALALAVAEEEVDAVRELMERGANPDIPIGFDILDCGLGQGLTARQIATKFADEGTDDRSVWGPILEAIGGSSGRPPGDSWSGEWRLVSCHPVPVEEVLEDVGRITLRLEPDGNLHVGLDADQVTGDWSARLGGPPVFSGAAQESSSCTIRFDVASNRIAIEIDAGTYEFVRHRSD